MSAVTVRPAERQASALSLVLALGPASFFFTHMKLSEQRMCELLAMVGINNDSKFIRKQIMDAGLLCLVNGITSEEIRAAYTQSESQWIWVVTWTEDSGELSCIAHMLPKDKVSMEEAKAFFDALGCLLCEYFELRQTTGPTDDIEKAN